MVDVLYFSDSNVKRKLLQRVAQARRPLWVVQVRHERHARPPAEREPFATLERLFGDVVDTVIVADEGTTEGMWRDPVGDLADDLFPDDKQQAYAAATGYLLLDSQGRPLAMVKKRGASTDELWFLQEAMAAHVPGVPAPDPAARPGKKRPVPPPPFGSRHRHNTAAAEGEHPTARAMNAEDPWQVLGLMRGTPLPEAKKAYRALVAQYHPDKVSHLAPEFRELADKRTRQILDAWRRIEDGEAGT